MSFSRTQSKIACVTGGSGMIGSKIVTGLLSKGFDVRVLSRKSEFGIPSVELFSGRLEDEGVLKAFLDKADFLFHCAAELNDESRMYDVNVTGTKRLISFAAENSISYFCHISSAGVVGKTNELIVDENTSCCPQNMYEKTKYEAEKIAARPIFNCRTVILRPTNVIDEYKPGALLLPVAGTISARLQTIIKGAESAHLVHADDVAAAAIYLMDSDIEEPEIFFVSSDHERLNTFAGIWSAYQAAVSNKPLDKVEPAFHLPIFVPHLMRKLKDRNANKQNIKYSSAKLFGKGFSFPMGFEGSVRQIAALKGKES